MYVGVMQVSGTAAILVVVALGAAYKYVPDV